MTATTIKQSEAIPAAYPPTPSGLSAAAAALDPDMIWQRLESYVAHRWTDRQVTWIAEGPGNWEPSLTPATITATEVWQSNAWAAVTLEPSPLGGHVLPGCGLYRCFADVGSGIVPAAVNEAFRRLAEYSAEVEDVAGASSFSLSLGDGFDRSYDRTPTWLARTMQNSGAGDLLRPYRSA